MMFNIYNDYNDNSISSTSSPFSLYAIGYHASGLGRHRWKYYLRVSRASQMFVSCSQPINPLADLQLLFTARILRTRDQLVRFLIPTLPLETLH
jgi:hypothetical protein